MTSDPPHPPTPPHPEPQGPGTPSAAARGQQMQLEMPADLEAIYANFVLLTHSPSEVLLDFARVLPNMKARVQTRVVLTPLNAKLLLHALADNLRKYESQFGEIAVPTQLADQLFRPPRPE